MISRWEAEQGLPESSATAIVQTPDGYLWFGTFDGLVRFDGARFVVFDQSNTPELPSAGIVSLHVDRSGRLWVGTLRGIAMHDGAAWRGFGEAEGWGGHMPRTFCDRADGALLVTTFNGLVLEYSGGRFHELPAPPGEAGRGYTGAADREGRWWVAQHRFVGWWNGAQWERALEPPPMLPENVAIAASRDGGVWVVVRFELIKFRDGAEVARLPLTERAGGIWSIFEDSRGNIWICTFDKGLCRVSPSGELRRWDKSSNLSTDSTRCVYEDRESTLWVGTSGAGLVRFKPRRVRALGVDEGLTHHVVTSVCPDPRTGMLIATFGSGLFSAWNGSVAQVPLPEVQPAQVLLQSVLTDRTGRTWIAAAQIGLLMREGGESRWFPAKETGGPDIVCLFEDSRGRVWTSGGAGVGLFEGGQFRVLAAEAGLPLSHYYCFAEDAAEAVWTANPDGVFRSEQGRFIEIREADGNPIRSVRCLKAEPDGTMWMGTSKGGLLRWRSGRLDRIDDRAGLPVRSIFGIIADDKGVWWMASERGILRAGPHDLHAVADGRSPSLTCHLLGVADGMVSMECAGRGQPVCARNEDGTLWFASRNGVAVVDPADFRLNTLPPPVIVEALTYFRKGPRAVGAVSASLTGGVRTLQSAPFFETLQLPPGSRRVEIQYTALSLASPESVRFHTMLEGLDEDWQDAGHRRSVEYNDLPPGDYLFRVRAANNDGVWNEVGASLAFTLAPHFWQTWWFGVGGGTLLIMVGGVIAWQISRVRERGRRQAEERFRLAIEASASAVVMADARGVIVLVNAQTERFFGYTRQEMMGRQVEMLLPDRFANHHSSLRSAYGSNPTPRTMGAGRELFGRRKDGSEFPLEIGLNPIHAAGGTMVLASIIDISERKRAELEIARQRNEVFHLSRVNMLSELSGSLAHELNQPLTAILSNAQAAQRFMERDPIDLGEVREILGDIVQQDKRAGEVIHRLRQLLKKGEVEPTELHISELVQDVLKLVRSDLINHGVSVRADLHERIPCIRGDRVHLQQVLINLVINGCDAMAENPSSARNLVVTAKVDEVGRVRVSVSDAGTGIAPEHLNQVFQPFFTTKPTGMGLGLAVCRTIITAHGGELRAANNPGRGATFYFTLPALTGAAE